MTLTVTLTLTLNLLKPNLAAELVGGDEVLGALGADPLLHELLRVRSPAALSRNSAFSLFFRLLFRRRLRTVLERLFFALGAPKPPKIEPKPSQNRAQNAPEIDLMLRTPKSDFEQTLPHFCSFLHIQGPPKSSRNRTRIRSYLPMPLKTVEKHCFC